MCHSPCVTVRKQLLGVGSLLPPLCEFQESNSGQQPCRARTVLAEPSNTDRCGLKPPSSACCSCPRPPLIASSTPVPVHTTLTLIIPDVHSSFISCDHPYLKTQRAKPKPPAPFFSTPIPDSPHPHGTTESQARRPPLQSF